MPCNTCSISSPNSGQRYQISFPTCQYGLPPPAGSKCCSAGRNDIVLTTNSEDLCESSSELPSDARPFASLLVSKTYFYIGILDEAVEFALKAGSAFEKDAASEYKETIIGQFPFFCLSYITVNACSGMPRQGYQGDTGGEKAGAGARGYC